MPHVYTSLRVRDNINYSFRRHHLQLTLQAIKNWRGGKDLGTRLWYTFVSTYFTYLCPKDTDLHDYATRQPFLKQPSIASFPGPSPASFPSLAVRLSVLQANGAGLGSGNEAKLNLGTGLNLLYVTTDVNAEAIRFDCAWERPLPVFVLPLLCIYRLTGERGLSPGLSL